MKRTVERYMSSFLITKPELELTGPRTGAGAGAGPSSRFSANVNMISKYKKEKKVEVSSGGFWVIMCAYK